jgi:hypothetical protein
MSSEGWTGGLRRIGGCGGGSAVRRPRRGHGDGVDEAGSEEAPGQR